MIYVDAVQNIAAFGHTGWCHLFSVTDDEAELHAFATRLGLKRAWYQGEKQGWPHYDVTAKKRPQAICLGAVPLDWEQTKAELLRRHRARAEARKVSAP